MNTQHLKYALEIERTGSISQAAENLYTAQPNLSKAIKELEEGMGYAIFERSSRGMIPTAQGERFLALAREMLLQEHEMESLGRDKRPGVQAFSLCMPRGGYIAEGVTRFVNGLDAQKDMLINLKESNSVQTINNVLSSRFHLGVIRYRVQHEAYFMDFLDEKQLCFEPLWEYDYLVLFSKKHPLAEKETLEARDLERYIELKHGDNSVPHLPSIPGEQHRAGDSEKRRILVYERSTQFEVLSEVPTTYMWVSPEPERMVERWNLVQRRCRDERRRYRDLLIYAKNYHLSDCDRSFIYCLFEARNDVAFREYS